MRRRPGKWAAIAAAVQALLAAPAIAQPSPSDDAFLQGKALMEQGRTAEACEKFEESLALARRGGTLLNLAVCREKEGRYATALRLFHEARERADKDGHPERATLADERILHVEGLVSWLTVRVGAGADAPDLAVQCDGEDLPRASWGKLRAVDPGPHVVTAVAAGRPRFEATVQIGATRDAQVVEIPAAEPPEARPLPIEAAAPPRPPEAPLPVSAPLPRQETAAAPRGWSTPVGGVALGLGAVVLATGTGFGIRAIVDVREANPSCPQDRCKTMAAYAQEKDAPTSARIADVTLPLGLVAAAAGLYLLIGRRPREPAAGALRLGVMTARGPGATIAGAF